MQISPSIIQAARIELESLGGAVVQRLDCLDDSNLLLWFRIPGRSFWLRVCAGPGPVRVHGTPERLSRRAAVPDRQRYLRRHVVGQTFRAVEAAEGGLRLRFDGGDLAVRAPGASGPIFRWWPAAGGAPDAVGRSRALHGTPSDDGLIFPAGRALMDADPWCQAAAGADTAAFSVLRAWRKKLRRLGEGLARDGAKMDALAADGDRAELLKSCLHLKGRGRSQVDAHDYVQGAPVTIVLRPDQTIEENMHRMFRRAAKGRRGAPIVADRRARLLRSQAALDELEALARAGTLDAEAVAAHAEALPPALRSALEGTASAPAAARPGKKAPPAKRAEFERFVRVFPGADDWQLWVGRGARGNDQLSFRYARGRDFWYHAAGYAGAHVVVRWASPQRDAGALPPDEARQAAMQLALHFSKARAHPSGEVLEARVRDLRRVKGQPGRVTAANAKPRWVRADPVLRRRLLGDGLAPSAEASGGA